MPASRRTLEALMSPWTTAGSRPSWRYSSAEATWNATATRRAQGRVPAPPWSLSWRSPLGAYSNTSTPSSRSSQ
uniref:Uncharacterized protein n=1 Tax=Zea mays TaxID=4577 RepID=C4J472_MAIZE|nr:unknown [Zea mays]